MFTRAWVAVIGVALAACHAHGPEADLPGADAADAAGDSAPTADAARIGDLTLYLAPTGHDTDDGRTPGTAIAGLDRAHDLLVQLAPTGKVRIAVAAGIYHCIATNHPWTFHNGQPVVIEPVDPVAGPASATLDDPKRPVFSGQDTAGLPCHGSSVFFSVENGSAPMKLTITGITITLFRGGITIRNGTLTTPPTTDAAVTIDNVAFSRLGDLYYHLPGSTSGVLAGKAAIMLSQTAGNRFTRNAFENIRNGTATAGLIHAFYLTALAQRNTIDACDFNGITGEAIKITHYSNNNVITNSRFSHMPVVIVDRWCGAREDPVTSCAGGVPECPSWGNHFSLTSNAWSSLVFPEPYVVEPIPSGQTCAFPPPSGTPRMVF